jgi:hypothetical protein
MRGARRPPNLGSLPAGARLSLVCGACTWTRSYPAQRLAARLAELGVGGPATPLAEVARHVRWPCPACRRMRWATMPEWAA